MRRRSALLALAGAGALTAGPARGADPALIAVVGSISARTLEPRLAAFRRGLAQVGLVEGRHVVLAVHIPGDLDRLPAIAESVVATRPRVIVASTPIAAIALRRATASIPIVVASVVDPVGAGLAASLARPGGNVTGLSGQELDVQDKLVGLIPDLLPRARRVLGVINARHLAMDGAMGTAFTDATRRLGLEPRIAIVEPGPDLPALRAAIDEFRPDALLVMATPVTVFLRGEIVAAADAGRIPVVAPYRTFAEAGALASYGPDLNRNWERVARYVDRILRGANPAEMPFEQPTGFELVINLRAARALGVSIPPILLAQADEVIE